MAVRRLHSDQPASFAFTPENLAFAEATIAKYPPGKQASAVIPLLMRAQEQHHGWLPEPAIRAVADMLAMAYIRVYEIATFYTQFQLAPVGKRAHVQVCGTTPCMLRGAEDLKAVCRRRIHHDQFHLSADGNFSWEEVECAGACANAPMVQIFKDTYEDLTPELLERVLDGFAKGTPPKPGSQTGRIASSPAGGMTALTDPTLYDGSVVGAWRQRFAEAEAKAAEAAKSAVAAQTAPPPASPAPPPTPAAAKPAPTVAAAATTAAGSAAALVGAAASTAVSALMTKAYRTPASYTPELLDAPRGGKPDDLKLIWGVAATLERKLNEAGVWHYDQIAKWTPENVMWFETEFEGLKGRVERDKWLEQCRKLADGWRPDGPIGQRPKG
jgi:NADH-quinone oxidoreductase subunit E